LISRHQRELTVVIERILDRSVQPLVAQMLRAASAEPGSVLLVDRIKNSTNGAMVFSFGGCGIGCGCGTGSGCGTGCTGGSVGCVGLRDTQC
jgi:hypothetical protein